MFVQPGGLQIIPDRLTAGLRLAPDLVYFWHNNSQAYLILWTHGVATFQKLIPT